MKYFKHLLVCLLFIAACSKQDEYNTKVEYYEESPQYDYVYIFCGTKLMMASKALRSGNRKGIPDNNTFLKFDPGLYRWIDDTGNGHVQYIGEGWSVHRSSAPSSFTFINQ